MNFRNVCALSVVAAMMIFAVPAMAQTTKLGVINVQKAVSLTTEGKAAMKKLDDMQKRIEKELKAKQDEILRLENELKNQGAVMSDDMKRSKIQDYQKKAGDFQQAYQDSAKKMSDEQQKLLTPIQARFEKIVAKLGKDEGYTAILHGEVVLYSSALIDLTDRVAKLYDLGGGK
jgi:outer membrane protein